MQSYQQTLYVFEFMFHHDIHVSQYHYSKDSIHVSQDHKVMIAELIISLQ